jgi:hypothetical protein
MPKAETTPIGRTIFRLNRIDGSRMAEGSDFRGCHIPGVHGRPTIVGDRLWGWLAESPIAGDYCPDASGCPPHTHRLMVCSAVSSTDTTIEHARGRQRTATNTMSECPVNSLMLPAVIDLPAAVGAGRPYPSGSPPPNSAAVYSQAQYAVRLQHQVQWDVPVRGVESTIWPAQRSHVGQSTASLCGATLRQPLFRFRGTILEHGQSSCLMIIEGSRLGGRRAGRYPVSNPGYRISRSLLT